MFPQSYFPDVYFPTAFFPKIGEDVVGAPPTVTGLPASVVTALGEAPLSFPFTIDDDMTAPEDLIVSATTGNAALIRVSGLRLSGSGENRVLELRPVRGSVGSTTITVSVTDTDGLQTQVTINYSVLAAVPRAVNDQADVYNGGSVLISVLANDRAAWADIDPQSLRIVTQPVHGTVRTTRLGEVFYTPDPAYTGEDSFQYTVADIEENVSNVATVSLRVYLAAISYLPPGVDAQVEKTPGYGQYTGDPW